MCFQFSLKMHHLKDVITNPYHVILPHIHQFIHEIPSFSIIRYLVSVSYSNQKFLTIVSLRYSSTTRKKLINDAFNASRKSYNDASLKRHGIDCHCIYLNTLTLVINVILF